ncbi:response regulator [Phenylobacterium sp.]|uniref:response regulator n=1 Tax=Phenylobacterium sp. TaxID=1871053 RepID=UPI00289EE4EE|nr:response regulator [Phenylobacterium sp.]
MRLDRLKILIVDDNKHTRLLLAQILRALGVTQTFEAGDGVAGLQTLRNHAIDIVLTDLEMEPLNGVDFVRAIRNGPESPCPAIPVIMITGHSTLKRIQEARDAGVNEFMAKPITARGVIERLQQVVDHARPFIRTDDYFGPDRRRRSDPRYAGPWRRVGDHRHVRALEL